MEIIEQQIIGQGLRVNAFRQYPTAPHTPSLLVKSFDKIWIVWAYWPHRHPVARSVDFHNPLHATKFSDHTDAHVFIFKNDGVFAGVWNLWPINCSYSWHVSPSLSSACAALVVLTLADSSEPACVSLTVGFLAFCAVPFLALLGNARLIYLNPMVNRPRCTLSQL